MSTENIVWKRASRCHSSSCCVEVAKVNGLYLVRDSESPDGPILKFDQGEWDAFVDGAKDGEFDVEA